MEISAIHHRHIVAILKPGLIEKAVLPIGIVEEGDPSLSQQNRQNAGVEPRRADVRVGLELTDAGTNQIRAIDAIHVAVVGPAQQTSVVPDPPAPSVEGGVLRDGRPVRDIHAATLDKGVDPGV